MSRLDDIEEQLTRELESEYETRFRKALAGKDREWLIDELVRLAIADRTRRSQGDEEAAAESETHRADRAVRVSALRLDTSTARAFAARHAGVDREKLVASGYLRPDAPAKGTSLIEREHRSDTGNALLQQAGDVLFGLLFGDETTGTHLQRVQRELLTLAVPRAKAQVLDYMRASTELSAEGTWQDPENVSNDEEADNVLIEVEFGETADEVVGKAIVAALTLINNLQINEQVLYARMINVEESTLIG